MNPLLLVFLGFIACLVIYWVFWGQRKFEEQLNPKERKELQAIVFDLDGVLIDSFEAWFNAINIARKKYGFKEYSEKEYRKKFWAMPLEGFADKEFPDIDKTKIVSIAKQHVINNTEKIKILPHAREVLEHIKKNRYKMALVTNNYHSVVDAVLKHHKLDSFFDTIVTFEDVQRPKPYADSLIKVCERLNLTTKEIIYIGDTKMDFRAAQAAGIFFVGLRTKGNIIVDDLKYFKEIIVQREKTTSTKESTKNKV